MLCWVLEASVSDFSKTSISKLEIGVSELKNLDSTISKN